MGLYGETVGGHVIYLQRLTEAASSRPIAPRKIALRLKAIGV